MQKLSYYRFRFVLAGERPHSCTLCNKGFQTSSDLKRHRRTRVHQEKVEQARANGEPIPDENEEAATNAANVNRSNRTTDSINTTIDYEVCDEDEEDLEEQGEIKPKPIIPALATKSVPPPPPPPSSSSAAQLPQTLPKAPLQQATTAAQQPSSKSIQQSLQLNSLTSPVGGGVVVTAPASTIDMKALGGVYGPGGGNPSSAVVASTSSTSMVMGAPPQTSAPVPLPTILPQSVRSIPTTSAVVDSKPVMNTVDSIVASSLASSNNQLQQQPGEWPQQQQLQQPQLGGLTPLPPQQLASVKRSASLDSPGPDEVALTVDESAGGRGGAPAVATDSNNSSQQQQKSRQPNSTAAAAAATS